MTETEAKKRLAYIAELAQEGLYEYNKSHYDNDTYMNMFKQILVNILITSEEQHYHYYIDDEEENV